METSNEKEKVFSRLLALNPIDVKDELDEKLEKCYNVVMGLTANGSEREVNDALNAYVSKSNLQHDEVQCGFLYAILVDQKIHIKCFRELNLVARDGLTCLLTKINQIVYEKWLKLLDLAKGQMLWLCRELVKMNALGADSVCIGILRQIVGGDTSQRNIWLAESMLELFLDHKAFLPKNLSLLATVIYTYLRIIVDHGTPNLANLRQKEVELCVNLLRNYWQECMQIGRDLIRLLQNVARIPEFDALWRDILFNPTVLSPTFTGVAQLLQIRTSRKFLIARLTPDMENKLIFLITKVRFGAQKRYQDWFQRQYLSTPESQSLRCDLIRYICAVFHPSNELLCSDIIPRWAVIGWLLTTCTSNVAASDAKLALFYDWLFFDPERDSIMNIEPAVLVMFHSMRPHPAITATLLDFMCRIMNNFSPGHTSQIKNSIYTALRTILEKRVLPSLSPLFDNPKLDKDLRNLLRENFVEFCSHEGSTSCKTNSRLVRASTDTINLSDREDKINEDECWKVPKDEALPKDDLDMETGNNHSGENNLSDACFSDDEEDNVPLGKLKEDVGFRPIKESPAYVPVDITEHINQLSGQIHDLTVELQGERNQEMQCDLTDKLMQVVIQEEDFDQEQASALATCLCQILNPEFHSKLFPQDIDEESIEDSIGSPLFVIFRFLSQMSEEDPRRQPVLQLLGEMYLKQPRIGYMLLYFLKVSKGSDEKMATYKDFCQNLDNKDLKTCLINDLKLCQTDDVRLFTYLIPDIYTHFPNIAVGNATILNLIVSSIDGSQLQDLICQILQGHLLMFKNRETFLAILNASLDWETIEQYFLWQLVMAHNIPVEHILPILPKLEFTANAEALTSLMVLLKQVSPSWEILRPVLSRECKKTDYFTVSILKYWAQEHEDVLAELIHKQLTKLNGTPKKRQRAGGTKKDHPTVDQILAHLDHMRQVCRNISFLNHENVQHALQQVQITASETQKTKYSDLLALAEDIDEFKTVRVLRGRKASNASGLSPKYSKSKKSAESESGSDSSDDDSKPQTKKRKKVTNADDESD
ncbi:integrator complex subunit 3-like isoform X1 [Biomphalaria glabrata]|uniref:Integrator complex subunit 3-like isoform X1 n=1 Tax=Biomphalaria glabrata TaxID=6526 RepID=A0A2C9LAH5_BIOGL|nr:integrator complex subunit 3-like isoform X1 [Biomphalaria glabrata]KAI8777522.1 integrator complex subunit 3 isoform X1 [Biomphalaria glabrata]